MARRSKKGRRSYKLKPATRADIARVVRASWRRRSRKSRYR